MVLNQCIIFIKMEIPYISIKKREIVVLETSKEKDSIFLVCSTFYLSGFKKILYFSRLLFVNCHLIILFKADSWSFFNSETKLRNRFNFFCNFKNKKARWCCHNYIIIIYRKLIRFLFCQKTKKKKFNS